MVLDHRLVGGMRLPINPVAQRQHLSIRRHEKNICSRFIDFSQGCGYILIVTRDHHSYENGPILWALYLQD